MVTQRAAGAFRLFAGEAGEERAGRGSASPILPVSTEEAGQAEPPTVWASASSGLLGIAGREFTTG